MERYWYLEHITTGRKIILQDGENVLGRHSECKFCLKEYLYLSRQHATFIVNIDSVIVMPMNALNGVYTNGTKMKENEDARTLRVGDRIGLGVEIDEPTNVVPKDYAIFVLKQQSTEDDDVVIISSDEEDEKEDKKENENRDITNNDNENRAIHLPKLPEVKQEWLTKASKEVENIFGEPDEELLETVFQVNPYIYKQLNNKNVAPTSNIICDGDVIEIKEEITVNEEILNDVDNDSDENFAMSQAVLQGMKEEMADVLADLSDFEFDDQDNDDPISPYNIKLEVATQFNEDEIIVIEDDDELCSKVADWSSKLLSQNVLSQIYPAEDKKHSDDDSDVEKQILEIINKNSSSEHGDDQKNNSIFTNSKSKVLRIESSDSEEEAPISNSASGIADKTTSKKAKLRRCSERLKSVDALQYQSNSHKKPATGNSIAQDTAPTLHKQTKTNLERSQSCVDNTKPTKSSKVPSQEINNICKNGKSKVLRIESSDSEEEVPISNAASGIAEKTILQKAFQRRCAVRLKSVDVLQYQSSFHEKPVASNSGDRDKASTSHQQSKTISKQSQPCEDKSKPIKSSKVPIQETNSICKNRKSKVLRIKSSDSEEEVPISNSTNGLADKTTSKKAKLRRCSERQKSVDALQYQCKSHEKPVTAKSGDQDNASTSHKQSKTISKRSEPCNDNSKQTKSSNVRGPTLIEPPHLPKHRGKLRGVPAEEKQPIEKSKVNPSTNNSNELKRKQKNEPTRSNSNSREFPTRDVSPAKKRSKLDKPRETESSSFPKRRATIECFSQKLKDTDSNVVKEPPFHYSRVPERKEAEKARNQRTCNRVTFADMERDFQYNQDMKKMSKRNRRVRFNDNVQIIYIERVESANKKVQNLKDTKKFSLSTYAERREWSLAKGKPENYSDLITGNILSWANQWLSLRNPDDVAERDSLLPIPSEFKSYKQYKEILIPLMKLELLTTIEREYAISNNTFEVCLKNISREDSRNRPRYLLTTRYNKKPVNRFDLYTLCSGDVMKETFATLHRMQRQGDNIYELTFDILQKEFSMEVLLSLKKLTVRPVVDNMRVELGAFNAVYQLGRSPLFERIIQPSKNVTSFDSKVLKDSRYKGFSKLNEHQLEICQNTWMRLIDDSTPSITLIQGPPGTGKSVVISNLTLQCLYGSSANMLDRKILICAHSNAAVDNITLYLNRARNCMDHSKFQLVRFGFLEKMDHKVRCVSLEQYLSQKRSEKLKELAPEYVESLLQQQLELNMEIADLKQRSIEKSSLQQQLKSKEQLLHLVKERLNPQLTPREEYEHSKKYIGRADIVCTTLSSCVKLASFIDYFDVCIIDEATQCTEPWTLLPLQFGVRSLVLVGDTQQLPATVLSHKAIKFGLGNSMFDRIQRNLKQQLSKERNIHFVHTKVFKLSMQYRMHPEICRWPNNYFYENELVNASTTQRLICPFIPYCIINLSFTRDTNDKNNRSISNDEEARFVAKLLVEMDKHMPTQRYKYGLITPYSNHRHALSQVIPAHMMITPQTVDAYQGQERDVIILSNARTRGIGFLTNYQRLNVAITRPRRCLILCGNFDDLKAVDLWRHLLEDARKRKIYFDLKRSDVDDLNRSLLNKILVKPVQV